MGSFSACFWARINKQSYSRVLLQAGQGSGCQVCALSWMQRQVLCCAGSGRESSREKPEGKGGEGERGRGPPSEPAGLKLLVSSARPQDPCSRRTAPVHTIGAGRGCEKPRGCCGRGHGAGAENNRKPFFFSSKGILPESDGSEIRTGLSQRVKYPGRPPLSPFSVLSFAPFPDCLLPRLRSGRSGRHGAAPLSRARPLPAVENKKCRHKTPRTLSDSPRSPRTSPAPRHTRAAAQVTRLCLAPGPTEPNQKFDPKARAKKCIKN